MESLLTEAAKQVPGLAVLVVMAWLFLRHMSEARTSAEVTLKSIQTDYMSTLKDIHTDNREDRRVAKEAITANTTATLSMTKEVHELIGVMRNYKNG